MKIQECALDVWNGLIFMNGDLGGDATHLLDWYHHQCKKNIHLPAVLNQGECAISIGHLDNILMKKLVSDERKHRKHEGK